MGGIWKMSNFMIILDILVVTGLCVSAILACHLEKLLSAVIALSVTGLFAAAAFLVLHAPDVSWCCTRLTSRSPRRPSARRSAR